MATRLLAEALVRWQHAAGPFWPYVCAAPFLGTGDGETLAWQAWNKHQHVAITQHDNSTGRHPARHSRRQTDLAARLLAMDGPPRATPGLPLPKYPARGPLATPDPRVAMGMDVGAADASYAQRSGGGASLLLVDLPAEPVLAIAPLLVERGWYVVPVVQRWIASPAVLPCRTLVERLVVGAWRARRPTAPRGAVLIADGERRGPTGYPATVPGRAFDNRYEYQICRFPSIGFLRAQGVERVRWITGGASPAERPVRPDLAPYLEDLLRAGLDVEVLPWPPRRSG